MLLRRKFRHEVLMAPPWFIRVRPRVAIVIVPVNEDIITSFLKFFYKIRYGITKL